jgi:hypothetical protein
MIETTVNLEEIANPFSFSPGTVVGYRANGKPIYNIAGGSIDIDTNDLVDNGDDDDDADEDDSDEDDYIPPTKEEFQKLLAAKQKADSEAAARKRFLREAGIDPKTGKPIAKPKIVLDDLDDDDDDSDDEVDQREARKAIKGEGKAKSDKVFQRQLEREIAKTERRIRDEATVLLAAVPTALNEAGWNGRNLERMIKLLDLDDIHVDSDGEIDGLQDQIDSLKEDFPEFFKRQRMKEAAKEVADTKTVGGGRKTAPTADTNMSWTDRLKADLYRS